MAVDPTSPFVRHSDGDKSHALLPVNASNDTDGKGSPGQALVVISVGLDGKPVVGGIAAPGGWISAGAANQDSTLVQTGKTTVLGLAFQNNHATNERFVKLYDKATAPTSTDTPAQRYALAPAGGGITRQPLTHKYVNGLGFRITTGTADNDVGAASAGDVFVNMDYF